MATVVRLAKEIIGRRRAMVKSSRRNTEPTTRRGSWYDTHMAAASRAIAQRIPLVDLVLEIRDARIPLSSEYELLRKFNSSSRRIVVLNKIDLANRSQTKEWLSYFEQNNCICYGVNAHNKDSIRQVCEYDSFSS
uniref:Uncharacterized protein n=1 Tax=Cannabis sativa TaxID=3483 RepID=A0A803PSX0_CANSA